MINKLRATQRDGAAAIVTALGRENIANLAAKLQYDRKHQVVRLKEIVTGGAEPTIEELVRICFTVSGGTLRYDEQADAVVTDAANALRAALIGRDLTKLDKPTGIPLFKLDSFRGAQDSLSNEQLDELVLHLFPGLKIDHETNTLVSRGYIEAPESDFETNRHDMHDMLRLTVPKRSRLPRVDPSLKSNEAPVPIGVFAPVAKGSERVDSRYALLTVENPGEARKRMLAKEQAIPYMR
ncbi:hypothetical protein ELI30_09425 [Rhizobium leguminosarum]|uniref:hypothetical protein n=1 Tax=Rhizobium leguminosarum TaxID=384 RepID=UPI00102FA746|nr:hypothetical protein [Rhizobium leguminosarum]TAV48504.1 hypothetical protein ELI32_09880 [Rhizobium leguminosarum]TAV58004.1 hypothetical protein ELI31_09410 [Rhizobium leguminosarum]TAV68945.1 hypothetical protein ELI30_09425 [Rhizobium leguminosarum]